MEPAHSGVKDLKSKTRKYCSGTLLANHWQASARMFRRLNMNGHFKFHLDENLRRKGPIRGFQVVEWKEI